MWQPQPAGVRDTGPPQGRPAPPAAAWPHAPCPPRPPPRRGLRGAGFLQPAALPAVLPTHGARPGPAAPAPPPAPACAASRPPPPSCLVPPSPPSPQQLVTMIINALVAVKRIQGFLEREEADLPPVRTGEGIKGEEGGAGRREGARGGTAAAQGPHCVAWLGREDVAVVGQGRPSPAPPAPPSRDGRSGTPRPPLRVWCASRAAPSPGPPPTPTPTRRRPDRTQPRSRPTRPRPTRPRPRRIRPRPRRPRRARTARLLPRARTARARRAPARRARRRRPRRPSGPRSHASSSAPRPAR